MKRKQKLKAGLLRKAVLRKAAACLILTAVFLASYGSGIAAVAKSMQDVEQSTTMKTASPMDAQPDLITLQQGDAVETAQNEYVLSLDGQWEMTSSGTEKGNLTNAWTNVNQVQVPGSISLALWKAGAIEDPYYGKNDAVAREQGQKTWYLRKNFTYNGSGERVQLAFEGARYTHAALIVAIEAGEIYVAAHTTDEWMKPLSAYRHPKRRFLHIEGVRQPNLSP